MAQFEEYSLQVKGLLAGEDVLLREGSRERWIRLIHSKSNSGRDEFFNIEDPIPVMLAPTDHGVRRSPERYPTAG